MIQQARTVDEIRRIAYEQRGREDDYDGGTGSAPEKQRLQREAFASWHSG